jgi:hypothetical protein
MQKLEEISLDNIDEILAQIEETKGRDLSDKKFDEQHLNEDDLLILQELENEKDID